MTTAFYIIFSIFILNNCSPPPLEPEPMRQIILQSSGADNKKYNNNLSFKRLSSE